MAMATRAERTAVASTSLRAQRGAGACWSPSLRVAIVALLIDALPAEAAVCSSAAARQSAPVFAGIAFTPLSPVGIPSAPAALLPLPGRRGSARRPLRARRDPP